MLINMEKIFVNEFIEIHYSCLGNTVFIKWLPDNHHMSEIEFKKQLDIVFNTQVLRAIVR